MSAQNTPDALTPAAKVRQAIGLLDAVQAGSSVNGRWLDARGDECDEHDPGATFTSYSEEEQGLWLASVSEQARQAKALLDAPDVQQRLGMEPVPDLRAVSVLHTLLSISETDAWGLGSERLTAALQEARELVSEAGPEYVIFSRSEWDASGDGAGFWSNEDGWVDRESATRFLAHERATSNLPAGPDVQWMSLAEAHGDVLIMERPRP